MPVVEIEARGRESDVRIAYPAAGCSHIARPRVGAEHLKAVREALVGAQQQPFVGLIAGRLPYLNRTGGAVRPRVILLSAGALGNHWAADAVEMVQVNAAWAQPPMDEMPEDEVCAGHEVTGDLALKPNVHVLRGPAWKVGGRYERCTLFDHLDHS